MIDLIQGDCLIEMKNIPDKNIDMILTDVPYNVVNRDSNGLRNLDKGIADDSDFDLEQSLKEMIRITKGSLYIFCSTEQVSDIRNFLAINQLSTRLCIWEKTNPSPMNGQHMWLSGVECCVYGKFKNATFKEHCKNTVWRYPTVKGKLHPTMKPVKLFQYLIETSSNENDIICDPFMGSGTTGVACINTNRHFIGIEKDENYFEIAQKRVAQAVQDKAQNLFKDTRSYLKK